MESNVVVTLFAMLFRTAGNTLSVQQQTGMTIFVTQCEMTPSGFRDLDRRGTTADKEHIVKFFPPGIYHELLAAKIHETPVFTIVFARVLRDEQRMSVDGRTKCSVFNLLIY